MESEDQHIIIRLFFSIPHTKLMVTKKNLQIVKSLSIWTYIHKIF